jgi:hypothetical protein
MAFFAVTGQPMYTPSPDPASLETLAVSSAGMAMGGWFVLAAWQWLYGHWWRSLLMILAFIAVAQAAVAIGLNRD